MIAYIYLMVADKMTDLLIDVIIVAVLFGALFPFANTQLNNMGLDNVTIFGSSYDFSWVAYLLVLAILFLIVNYAVKTIKKK